MYNRRFSLLAPETGEPVEEDMPRRRAHSTDRDELSLIRTMIFDLQEEKDKLKQGNGRLSEELYKKQKHLDDLYNLVGELKEVKADKELLSVGFELKADKREVETKIGRDDFDHCMGIVDQSLKDLLLRLDGHVSCFYKFYNLGSGGCTWINVWWVCAAGLSESLPHFSLFFFDQLRLTTLLKMRPHSSLSSRENATPVSGTSPLASCKGVFPPPPSPLRVYNLYFLWIFSSCALFAACIIAEKLCHWS